MLAAGARLRRQEDFSLAVRKGRRATRGSLVVHLVSSEDGSNPARPYRARAGFVVSKAVGNAVTRNTVKRRLRHIVREHLGNMPPASDVVVRAMPSAAARSYRGLESDFLAALGAASRPRNPK